MNRATEPSVIRAVHAAARPDRQIGALLIDAGKLSIADAEKILRLQKERKLLFGEAGIALGLIEEADLQRVLAVQYDFAYLSPGESRLSKDLIAAFQPFARQVEMFRAVRSQLMLRWFSQERKCLSVVSPERREGRSYLTANLAIVFAQLGERTLLIDTDMRTARQHLLFGLENSVGLTTYLSRRTPEPRLHRVAGLGELYVLSAGPTPPNPQELAARAEFAALLETMHQQFDVILLDTPAATGAADAQTIAALSGGALLLSRQDHTRLRRVDELAAALRGVGVQVVGSVLARF